MPSARHLSDRLLCDGLARSDQMKMLNKMLYGACALLVGAYIVFGLWYDISLGSAGALH
jgi:hypothetical protein